MLLLLSFQYFTITRCTSGQGIMMPSSKNCLFTNNKSMFLQHKVRQECNKHPKKTALYTYIYSMCTYIYPENCSLTGTWFGMWLLGHNYRYQNFTFECFLPENRFICKDMHTSSFLHCLCGFYLFFRVGNIIYHELMRINLYSIYCIYGFWPPLDWIECVSRWPPALTRWGFQGWQFSFYFFCVFVGFC